MSYGLLNNLLIAMTQNIYTIIDNSVNPKLVEIYKSSIMDNVYNRQRSGLYERTYTLLESSSAYVKLNQKIIEIDIYNDEKKMLWKYPSHSPNSPNDNRSKIVEYVNYGNVGGLYPYDATNYFTIAKENIYSNITSILILSLQNAGMEVVK
jgi:hypothetical protein